MKTEALKAMTKGWFVGDFSPTALRTTAAEAALKTYSAGDREPKHVHKIATEVTLVVSGMIRMNGTLIGGGQIVVLEPGEPSDFFAVEDTVLMVVKVPCVAGDKYVIEE